MPDAATSPCPIRLAVRSVDGLLDAEGSPLAEPRLHPEFAHAVWSEALQGRSASGFHLDLTVPPADSHRETQVTEAVHFHFQSRQREFA
jgi:hypothetical protein